MNSLTSNRFVRHLLLIVAIAAGAALWWHWRSGGGWPGGTGRDVISESVSIPSARAGVSTLDPLGEPDAELAAELGTIAGELGITELAAHGRASVMLVDLGGATEEMGNNAARGVAGDGRRATPRHAGIAADSTLAAASVTKLAILTAAYAAVEAGEIAITPELRAVLERMIRYSANPEATRAIEVLGFERIAAAMRDPRIALYDEARGGLWVGRDFTGGAVWRVEPRSGESLAASAAAVARFYVLMARGELVSPEASVAMRDILAVTMWKHKFVAGLGAGIGRVQPPPARASSEPVVVPGYRVWRKSGSYGPAQGDSALIEADGRRYVLVCLLEDREGGEAKLQQLAARVDRMMAGLSRLPAG
jgi:beta-lactamase class A